MNLLPARAVLIIILVVAGCQQQRADVVQPATSGSQVRITPQKLDFGIQSVSVASAALTATLSNSGNAKVLIRDITASGIDFAETNDCQPTLAPGGSCTFQVTFKPAITGPRMGAVIISESDPASPLFLVLTGTGQ